MKKYIAEELPARQHPQAEMSKSKGPDKRDSGKDSKGDDSSKTPEQRIRQAVYDIRYRARRERLPLRTAYSQYMQNSSMAEQEKAEVRKKLFGDIGGSSDKDKKFVKAFKKPGMQAEDFEMEMKDFASHSMANALYKVFAEKKVEVVDIDQLKSELEEAAHFNKYNEGNSKKYKIRVRDKQSGVTYTRYATREKINELRARGLDVEFTQYGDAYEGDKEEGKKPNDGNLANNYPPYDKVTRGDVVAGRRGKDQMGGKNVKEGFLGEIAATANLPQTDQMAYVDPNMNTPQIDFTTKKNKIVVNPSDSSGNKIMSHYEPTGQTISENGYSRFLNLLQEKKMTAAKKKKEKKLKKKYDESDMKKNMMLQYGSEKGKKVYFAKIRKEAMKEESECGSDENKDEFNIKDKNPDPRSLKTAVNLAKTSARYRGIKNPLVMVSPE